MDEEVKAKTKFITPLNSIECPLVSVVRLRPFAGLFSKVGGHSHNPYVLTGCNPHCVWQYRWYYHMVEGGVNPRQHIEVKQK